MAGHGAARAIGRRRGRIEEENVVREQNPDTLPDPAAVAEHDRPPSGYEGETLADGDFDAEGEAVGDTDALGDPDADGDPLADGETDSEVDPDGA
jgi:hypothetical protein